MESNFVGEWCLIRYLFSGCHGFRCQAKAIVYFEHNRRCERGYESTQKKWKAHGRIFRMKTPTELRIFQKCVYFNFLNTVLFFNVFFCFAPDEFSIRLIWESSGILSSGTNWHHLQRIRVPLLGKGHSSWNYDKLNTTKHQKIFRRNFCSRHRCLDR